MIRRLAPLSRFRGVASLMLLCLLWGGSASLTGCVTPPLPPDPRLTPADYSELEGWSEDRLEEARPAFINSCTRLLSLPDDRSLGGSGTMGTVGDWRPFCEGMMQPRLSHNLRAYLEVNLQPWAVTNRDDPEGLFTGYYESELHGSLKRHGPYQTPLYRLPPEVKTRKVGDAPYFDRAAITQGALAGRGLELVWLDDPIDAFFVQIQGSGRVVLDTGEVLHVGYAGKNGHPYVAIGRELVERGEMALEDVSMQSIRHWLETHPAQRDSLLNANPSYVFFRILTAEDAAKNNQPPGPQGAANVTVSAMRSLAVDDRFIGYHVPVWLQTNSPQLRRLVVAQDTGGAIKGVVRGDFFWGHGSYAEHMAGLMNTTGRYYVLLPRGFVPPLPPRPSYGAE